MNFLDVITIFAFLLEIAGVILMANRFLHVSLFALILAMLIAPFGGRFVKRMAIIAEISQENASLSFRGLSLVFFGFSIQLAVFVLKLPYFGFGTQI